LVVSLGILNEYVKSIKRNTTRLRSKPRDSSTLNPFITNKNGGEKGSKKKGIVTVLTFFTLSIDYVLMLVAMTFNFGYFFATIFGVLCGNFFFSFDDESDIDEGRQLSEANCC
jgi:hypothetical protein